MAVQTLAPLLACTIELTAAHPVNKLQPPPLVCPFIFLTIHMIRDTIFDLVYSSYLIAWRKLACGSICYIML